jgi:FkbM family methyltransferase
VYSFEPDKEAREIQHRNIEANDFQNKITILPYAISEKDGYIKFNSMGGNSNSHIVKTEETGENIITIQTRSINSLLTELPKPTWVKIDVEGAEVDVLRGAGKLLNDKNVRFICELHPFAWETFGVSYDEFMQIIHNCKRTIQVLDNRKSLNDLPYYGTVLF